jgi:hypothetical protein
MNPEDTLAKSSLKSAIAVSDWQWKEHALLMYQWAITFNTRFFTDAVMPEPVIAFDRLNIKTLAAYTLKRNPQGLLDAITFNVKHFDSKNTKLTWRTDLWGELETLLHEQVHLWQQNFGEHPIKPGRIYHNTEFVTKCETLGLHPKAGKGYHTQPADGKFAELMQEFGIVRAAEVAVEVTKGRSTLHKWECPECGLILRVGVMDDIQVSCVSCTELLDQMILFTKV